MEKELSFKNIVYEFSMDGIKPNEVKKYIPQYEDVYKRIRESINIKNEGFNIYLIDEFSKNKLENLKNFISDNIECKAKPDDICYVVYSDEKKPKSIKLKNGKGNELKEVVEKIQKEYFELTYKFYNTIEDKENITKDLKEIKNKLISELVEKANEDGFDMKFDQYGFSFVPLKNGKVIEEQEYEDMANDQKKEILSKFYKLKEKSNELLVEVESLEKNAIEKIKIIMQDYYEENCKDIKKYYRNIFEEEVEALKFLEYITKNITENIINNYSINYDNDEEKIEKSIYKYSINVLVDNSKNVKPPIIFEDDPNVNNLLGDIEYESENGAYKTDISYIKAGDILKANEGYLILRANSLLKNPSSYYYLKKALMSGTVDYKHANRYLELISLNGIEPEPIKFRIKVIIIGDYQTYDILYNYDEDFKTLFKLKAQYNPIVKINDKNKSILVKDVLEICENNNIKLGDFKDIKEIARFLSKKCEDKRKLYFDEEEVNRLLILAKQSSGLNNRKIVAKEDILDVAYKKDIIEKEIYEEYIDKRILIDVVNKTVGQINGLAVLESGYFSFGKPIKITCACYKGEGNIIDVEKESDLSGNIHNKSINILKGCINNLVGGYSKLPVDFHLCFEQLYGKIEGDSASVAEFISMISSLSKIPIKQNIAVTGSINQFGIVQPIGGVNEKIQGFYNVCKMIDTIEGKGVLIPESNKENIVLSEDVERQIKANKFHIYVMKDIRDAIQVLMCDNKETYIKVIDVLNKELKKYKK